ncbi:MAG TPA: PaaI family thioesterase [Actinomycetota bacterium]|jgi:acyl-coenzyme A thioesterase PaaI-like protein
MDHPVTEGRLLPSHQRLCLGCGTDHPSGLGIVLRGEGTRVTGSFVVGHHHEGAPGLAHGGIVATALDEAMAGLLWLLRQPAVTSWLEVEFHRPVPTGSRVDLDADLDRREAPREGGRGKIYVRATARIGDEVVAEGRSIFVEVEMDHFAPYIGHLGIGVEDLFDL